MIFNPTVHNLFLVSILVIMSQFRLITSTRVTELVA